MKICEIIPKTGLFEGERIHFLPGVNLIRGDNGIGKTAILEYASLLGHVAIMDYADSPGAASLIINVALSLSDREFLARLRQKETHDSLTHFDSLLAKIELTRDDLAKMTLPAGPFPLYFFYNKVEDDYLKSILPHEEKIKNCIRVRGESRDHVKLVKALNLWTRPMLDPPPPAKGKWMATPRFIHANGPPTGSGDGARSIPAPVFYFNTDMYEFGTGLDIRESPKHLSDNLAPVLLERLQLVSYEAFEPSHVATNQDMAARFKHGGSHLLSGSEDVGCAWKRVFPGQEFGEVRVQWGWSKSPDGNPDGDKDDFKWSFHLSGRRVPEFVSSGQNQAFFLLAVMHGLVSEGSCMLLDEPELHLSSYAGTEIVREIFQRAKQTRSQAVIVTHLPDLHQELVRDMEKEWESLWSREALLERARVDGGGGYDYDDVRMIYVYKQGDFSRVCYDWDAIMGAASPSHADVMKLVEGLRVPDKIPLAPSWREIGRDLYRLLPGWRDGEAEETAGA